MAVYPAFPSLVIGPVNLYQIACGHQGCPSNQTRLFCKTYFVKPFDTHPIFQFFNFILRDMIKLTLSPSTEKEHFHTAYQKM